MMKESHRLLLFCISDYETRMGWCRGTLALTGDDEKVDSHHPDADKVCAMGSLHRNLGMLNIDDPDLKGQDICESKRLDCVHCIS